ncbi:MAG TPA: tRNA (adenosine(37)-N6)-threonylcarbamoyltransferase complex ATPase subunit type 1 TsaE [Methylophilus sp.]
MIKQHFTRILADEAATLAAGKCLALALQTGLTVYLHGDLGAGKTTFVRGVLQGLGYQGKVKSPTYTLVESYSFAGLTLYHFDLYRFLDEEEWDAAGFREYFNVHSVCMIEWPEKAHHVLPSPDIDLTLTHQSSGRLLQYQANTDLAEQVLANMENTG